MLRVGLENPENYLALRQHRNRVVKGEKGQVSLFVKTTYFDFESVFLNGDT